MMSIPNFITVWEWEAQPCLWVPFPPKMSCYIEEAFRQSKGSVDLGAENQELACFNINFSVLKQVNTITNESTRVRQQQYPCTCPLAKGILWMWWSDFRWELYDVLTSMYIEDEFQKQSQFVDLSLSPLRIPNIIDFTTMVQTNRDTKKSRKIERHKTTEQYPVAVVHRQPMTNFPPAPMAHRWSNRVPVHGTYGQPTYGTSNLLVPSNTPNGYSADGNSNGLATYSSTNTLPINGSNMVSPLYSPTVQPGYGITVQPTHGTNAVPPHNTGVAPVYSSNGWLAHGTNGSPPPGTIRHPAPGTIRHPAPGTIRHPAPGTIRHPAYSTIGHPTHGTTTTNNFTRQVNTPSSNLLFHTSGVQNTGGNLINGLGMNYGTCIPQTGSCLYSPSIPAMPRSPQHVQDRNDEILGSTPPRKKMKTLHGGPLGCFTVPVTVTGRPDDECAICLEILTKPSEYDLTDPGNPPAEVQCVSPDILQLVKCKHLFHRICLQKMYNSGAKNGCLQCPTCKTIHGVKKGNQPSDGKMDIETNMIDIPGYPGCGSILIVYNFKAGVQGESHPNPGQPYTTNSFPRTCYLPNNTKGQKVLRLLKKAFERQLIFTIGMSVTTGVENTVVWNDIHHKTEGYHNRTGFGYPDPKYLDSVLAELASHGVTDDDD